MIGRARPGIRALLTAVLTLAAWVVPAAAQRPLSRSATSTCRGDAQSMGSKGDCFDNAVAESFFATKNNA